MDQLFKKIEHSLHKGFLDQNIIVPAQFKPKLLTNKAHENVLSSLLQELKTCKNFTFSVAFITEGGLATLKTMLHDLQKKGIKGRILTSTFLNFNHPKMFQELLKLENVEVRLTGVKGFHSKGYIFEHKNYYSLIVGSSNLTDSALKANYEWNIFLTSLENGEVINHFKNQFEDAWNQAIQLDNNWIDSYKAHYKQQPFVDKQLTNIFDLKTDYLTNPLAESLSIQPNSMQLAALKQLAFLRESGASKGLIISATGTGKTYLSAFDVRSYAPKRMLFVVHREQILKKAMVDYRKILGGNDEDYGLLSGSSKNYTAKYLFATVQTLASANHLHKFSTDEFDYILLDEVHRAGAQSYEKILNYFNPKFLLGMTATPERTDETNIYEIFDYNIAYEIRLQAALEADMLCPFHYFGVTDYEIDGNLIDDTADLRLLASEERVAHILEKINYYGFSGDRVRGLIFCSSIEETQELSTALNLRGLKTVALTGNNSQDEREEAVEKLNRGELEYILTRDIFNEGVDIPFLNQIIMLRQTQSSIIFIQQLGRGLRKHDSKEYVTIIDFIGNYKNNYLIPIALSGDQSLNKDNVRRKTVTTDYIQGISTINFEEIAKKRIFDAIDNTNLSTLNTLKDAYTEMKNRLGRIPTMYDFLKQNSLDPEVIINYSNSYYNFLLKMKEDIAPLSDYEIAVLMMFSKEFMNGKRMHEVLLIEALLKQVIISKPDYINLLKNYGTYTDDATLNSVENIFSLNFFVAGDPKKFGEKPILLKYNDTYRFNDKITSLLQNAYFKSYVEDIIACAYVHSNEYSKDEKLTINQKYSRRDVCRLLNYEKNEEGTLNGGRIRDNVCLIFVNYHKNDKENSETLYMDKFLSSEVFRWCSTKKRNTESPSMKPIIYNQEHGITVYLFAKKHNGEGKDFYYLGPVNVDSNSAINTHLQEDDTSYPVVTMNFVLEQPVQYDIFHYLVEE